MSARPCWQIPITTNCSSSLFERMPACFCVTQREGGVDYAEMSEGLRKSSERVTAFGIDLLGKKIDIVRIIKRSFENLAGFLMPAGTGQKIHLPKTAQGESAFAQFEATLVPVNQSRTRNQFFANPHMRFLHPLRAGFFKSVIGEQERARIDNVAAASLRINLQRWIPGMYLDFRTNALLLFFTFRNGNAVDLTARLHFQEAIERDPAQQARVGVVPTFVPIFPHTIVRFAPMFANISGNLTQHFLRFAIEIFVFADEMENRFDHFPINI